VLVNPGEDECASQSAALANDTSNLRRKCDSTGASYDNFFKKLPEYWRPETEVYPNVEELVAIPREVRGPGVTE
jgi:hypothetical protein